MPVEKETASTRFERLGNRIKQLRKAKGYTNADHFAYEHGMSRSQYREYERGVDIRYSTIEKLCAFFNITLEEFFNESFRDHPKKKVGRPKKPGSK